MSEENKNESPAAKPVPPPAPPAPTEKELQERLSKQVFTLGQKTYVFEAERRVMIDGIATTANSLNEIAKQRAEEVAKAAAVKTDQ